MYGPIDSDTMVGLVFKSPGELPESLPDWILVLSKKYKTKGRDVPEPCLVVDFREPIVPEKVLERTVKNQGLLLHQVCVREVEKPSGEIYNLLSFYFRKITSAIIHDEATELLQSLTQMTWGGAIVMRNETDRGGTRLTLIIKSQIRVEGAEFSKPDKWGIRHKK